MKKKSDKKLKKEIKKQMKEVEMIGKELVLAQIFLGAVIERKMPMLKNYLHGAVDELTVSLRDNKIILKDLLDED